MRPDHDHRSVRDWILLFEEAEPEDTVLASCARAREAWIEGLGPWMEHAVACTTCRAVARLQEAFSDEYLDCPDCRGNLEMIHRIVEDAEHYEPSIAWEIVRAEEHLEEMQERPLDEQMKRVLTQPFYQQWGFVQRVLADAREHWHRNPALALDRALLAVVAVEQLDPISYGEQWIADLEAKAHAYVANAHRILGDFRAAEAEFRFAEKALRRGVGSGVAEARVDVLKASLLNDQHRHREALALLASVEEVHQERGEIHEIGRIALQRAHILYLSGDPLRAADECGQAAATLDADRSPELALIARKNAIEYLLAAGEVERARSLFDQLPAMPEPLDEVRRLWVEANLLRLEGRHGDACRSYERVRQGFAGAGLHYDAAVVSLDLALSSFEEVGHTGRVRLMVQEAIAHLALAEAKQEAFTALGFLLRAIHEDAVTLAVLDRVRQRVAALQPS